jgi:hypothetical protein
VLGNYKQIEELKMFSKVKGPLIFILEKFSKDPTINVHQAGFGSYIANYVIKEKIETYNNEAMIPSILWMLDPRDINFYRQRDTQWYSRLRI